MRIAFKEWSIVVDALSRGEQLTDAAFATKLNLFRAALERMAAA